VNLSLAENWPLGGKVVGRGVQSDATWFWDCRPYHRLVVTALAERPLLPPLGLVALVKMGCFAFFGHTAPGRVIS
jgi:hypothetical protein